MKEVPSLTPGAILKPAGWDLAQLRLLFLCRAFEDEKKARMGVVECAKHELLQPFNVLYEKEGECCRWEGWGLAGGAHRADSWRSLPEAGDTGAGCAIAQMPGVHFKGLGICPPGKTHSPLASGPCFGIVPVRR